MVARQLGDRYIRHLYISFMFYLEIQSFMRLHRVRIKNFRSIFKDEDEGDMELEIELSPDGNYIVGPNNVGKSNVFRALRLALEPESVEYDPKLDQPKQMRYAYPTITLDFQMERQRSPYKTLLRYVEEYERSIVGEEGETFAEDGKLRFYVQYRVEKDSRTEMFQAKGEGAIRGDEELLERALDKFHETIRLVDIESGEDLDSLLQRGFKELFARVLSERYRAEIENAEELREGYLEFLSEDILGEVDNYISEELSQHLGSVTNVNFSPNIQSINGALSNIHIEMNDSVSTPLAAKGTGVRSMLIQMIMAFIADASRRAIIFAIEEPEAFLHPEKHAELGSNLESFTDQSDISVLITTHSPFILTNNTSANVFTATKNADGRTTIKTEQVRQLAINNAKKLLTGANQVPSASEAIDSVPENSTGIVVVEGWTDKSFFETAALIHDDEDPLEDVFILDSDGASDALKHGVVMNEVFGNEKSVVIMLDADEPGKSAYNTLTSKLGYRGGEEVFLYREWRREHNVPVEAEDLFSQDLVEGFIENQGEDVIDGWRERSTGHRHYDIKESAKQDFAEYVAENADSESCSRWLDCMDEVRSAMVE